MADWIKVETTSSQKIEVLTMADILDIDEHAVFGKLVILWCWADANTVDGNAQGVTKRMIDRVACNAGFADAMLQVGWLEKNEGNLYFPNFDRHNGKGAKKRATTARRVDQHRKKPESNAPVTKEKPECNAQSVTESVTSPLPDKRREDKNINNINTMSAKPDEVTEIFSYWKEVMQKSGTTKPSPKRIKAIQNRLKDGYSIDEIKTAIFNCSNNSFNMGKNPDRNPSGRKYDDIELICRNAEKLEQYRDNPGDMENGNLRQEALRPQSKHDLSNIDYGQNGEF